MQHIWIDCNGNSVIRVLYQPRPDEKKLIRIEILCTILSTITSTLDRHTIQREFSSIQSESAHHHTNTYEIDYFIMSLP